MTTHEDHINKRHEDLVNEAVLILAGVPVPERPIVMTKLGVAYEERYHGSDLGRDMVVAMSRLWIIEVLEKLEKIDLTSGPTIGMC